MRGDSFFRDAVHFGGADLHFEGLAAGNHRSVQRLVAVRTRQRNEVLDAARDRPPRVVNDAQRGITVLDVVGDDAKRQKIVDLIDGDSLLLRSLR